MSKLYILVLLVIGGYIFIIMPDITTKKEEEKDEKTHKPDTRSGTGLSENADENGASVQQKYRIGYTK